MGFAFLSCAVSYKSGMDSVQCRCTGGSTGFIVPMSSAMTPAEVIKDGLDGSPTSSWGSCCFFETRVCLLMDRISQLALEVEYRAGLPQWISLCEDAIHAVQSTAHAWRAMFHKIAAYLSCSAIVACVGCTGLGYLGTSGNESGKGGLWFRWCCFPSNSIWLKNLGSHV